MLKKTGGSMAFLVLSFLVFSTLPVFAEEDKTAELIKQREEVRAEAQKKATEIQAEADKKREEMRVETTKMLGLTDPKEIAEQRAEMEKKRLEFETEASKKREERRMEAEQKRAELGARLGEIQAKRAEFQKENALRKAENTSKVILATIDRLSNIADRIVSRIAKLKEGGADTTESEGFMNAARADLEAAKTSATAIASLDLSGETAQENFEKIRIAAAETKEHIRSAHKNLADATSALATLQASMQSAPKTSTAETED